MDGICAIDLDTILPCYFISRFKKVQRVYDAHELFCEMKEIVQRPLIYRVWKTIERWMLPKFPNGYTVNKPIADEFKKMYGLNYEVIRNIALSRDIPMVNKTSRFIIYQGAVNEGRSFETLIPAMKYVSVPLIICGDGNFLNQAKELVRAENLEAKVIFKGKLLPEELRMLTAEASIGVTLFDDRGKSNYYSLANRFFDYIHAGIPQLCVDYPVYRQLNNEIEIAVLIKEPAVKTIALALQQLLDDDALYQRLYENCLKARSAWNWQQEEVKLVEFYRRLFQQTNNS